MGRVRVAVLGHGAMGRLHLRVLRGLAGDVSVTGIFDVDAEKTRGEREARGSAREAIADADLVVVATPIATHAELAMSALREGRHVLVEKPMCRTAREADAMLDAASRAGRLLFVGHSERFNPAVRSMVATLAPRDVLSLEFIRLAPLRKTTRSLPGPGSKSGDEDDLFLNLGVHDLDLAAYLTRSPLSLESLRHAREGHLARIEFTTVSGTSGRIEVGRVARAPVRGITVRTRFAYQEADLLRFPSVYEEPLVAQARAVCRALAGNGGTELASGEDGADAVRAAERAAARPRGPASSVAYARTVENL